MRNKMEKFFVDKNINIIEGELASSFLNEKKLLLLLQGSLNDKSGLNLQGIVSAVHDYQKDTSKCNERNPKVCQGAGVDIEKRPK